jgi:hypothetical protein
MLSFSLLDGRSKGEKCTTFPDDFFRLGKLCLLSKEYHEAFAKSITSLTLSVEVRPWLLVVAFGTTAPIGQAIGLATRSSYDPNSAFGLIIVGVFNAM